MKRLMSVRNYPAFIKIEIPLLQPTVLPSTHHQLWISGWAVAES